MISSLRCLRYYTTNQYDVDMFEMGTMSQREDLHEFDEPNSLMVTQLGQSTSQSCSLSSQLASVKGPPVKVTAVKWRQDHLCAPFTYLNPPKHYCNASTPLQTLKLYPLMAVTSFTSSYSDLLEWILSILKMQLHRQQFTELKSPQKQQRINSSHISMQNPSLIPEIP